MSKGEYKSNKAKGGEFRSETVDTRLYFLELFIGDRCTAFAILAHKTVVDAKIAT